MARRQRPEAALQAALEGGFPGESDLEVGELVALARRLPSAAPAGPTTEVAARLRERLNATLEEGLKERAAGWLKSWVGGGAIPRPLTQRLAAGFLVLGAFGSGAAGATGSNPADWVSDAGDIGLRVIRNLGPGSGGEGSGVPTPEAAVTETPPPATETVSPAATPGPSATVTPDDEDELEDEDESEDSDERDNSGPGSDDSGPDEYEIEEDAS